MLFADRIRKIVEKMQHTKMIAIPETIDSNHLLDGKNALIIGGTSGIGYSIAQEFKKNGCRVIIAGRSENKIKGALKDLGGESYGIIIDLMDPNSFERKIKECSELLSGATIDILVNSGGVRSESAFFDCKSQDFDMVYKTNIRGVYLLSQEMSKYMIENKIKGHILNISSSSALRPAQSPYQISKWAIRGMTMGMADVLYPYGIIVNAIAPGPTATPMLGIDANGDIGQSAFYMGRYELPRETAQLAVFMVSPLGDVVIGDTLYATGGSGTMSMHR